MKKFTKVRKRRILANIYVTTEDMELITGVYGFRNIPTYYFYKGNAYIYQVVKNLSEFYFSLDPDNGKLGVKITIDKGFRFDGATAWWDKWILEAALFHDAMCRFLPQEFRPLADEIFRINVAKSTNRFYARLLWLGVVGYRKIRGG